MAVRHVQHERPEHDPPRGFGERRDHVAVTLRLRVPRHFLLHTVQVEHPRELDVLLFAGDHMKQREPLHEAILQFFQLFEEQHA